MSGYGRIYATIDLDAVSYNLDSIQKKISSGTDIIAVVKADGYGHGALEISRMLERETRVFGFAVASAEEAFALRDFGIQKPVLILGYTFAEDYEALVRQNIRPTVYSYEMAKAYDAAARKADTKALLHIKIDTGMHRLGISSEEISAVRKVFEMKNLKICGIYTHLCCADSRLPEDIAFTRRQIDSFYRLTDALKNSGIQLPKLHIQSSYGFLNYPDLVCDYVRVGIALYGVSSVPDNEAVLQPALRPVLALKSRVVLIRFIGKGDSVGYGRTFVAGRDSRIAVIPVGYGDGFPGSLSGKNVSVLINRKSVPVVGRICMDQLTVDITDAENVKVGDVVTLIGTEEEQNVSAPVVAQSAGSISNELLCRLGTRLPIVMK